MGYLLHHYLAESAGRFPERVAVRDRDRTLSYRELDERSSRLAELLVAGGLQPGDRVGLYFPKSLDSIVAVTGIHKAGGVYVPVDPKAPAARAAFILQDCRVRALVTTARHLRALAAAGPWGHPPELVLLTGTETESEATLGARVEAFDATASGPRPMVPVARIDADLAYILYTSGSTGQPKGVMLSHAHAVNYVEWVAETFETGENDVFSSHAPLHFDLSILDIFAALRSGATLALVPEQLAPFPTRLAEWIEDQGITVWYSVPSALTMLVTRGGMDRFAFRSLRIVFFAGEVFPMKYLELLRAAVPAARLVNLYGPTETNVCTWYEVPQSLSHLQGDIPIGKPCANMDAFPVTAAGRRARAGEEGELHARGACLMTGYWGRPDLTAERLFQNPLHDRFNDPVYATGDIVRVAFDGNFEFVGRRDHMVKSRGYRIELGEIESVIHRHPGVAEAAVVTLPDDEIGCRLMAAAAPAAGASLTDAELRQHCAAHLPRYMIPEQFHVLDALPRTSTGKTDRQRLQALVVDSTSAATVGHDAGREPGHATKGNR